MENKSRPRTVIVGAGFAGLSAAMELKDSGTAVLLIDRNNYHTFQALLYQVATAALEPEAIAYPVRTTLKGMRDIDFLLADVRGIDLENRLLATSEGPVPFDRLILAAGSVPSTFGIPGIEENSFFLKTLEEGVDLRNHLMCVIEKASRETDPETLKNLLTFVVAGGGATGVEFAGALSELLNGSLKKDFPALDLGSAQVFLVEASDRLLPGMDRKVAGYALERLTGMGVRVMLSTPVEEAGAGWVKLKGHGTVKASTIVWTAGVKAAPLAAGSGMAVNKNLTLPVLPTLEVEGCPGVYAAGDMAAIKAGNAPLPMVAQVAIQSGRKAASNIKRELKGLPPEKFTYKDLGSMVVVGRNAAGAHLGNRVYTGFFAWLLWLLVHLARIIGYRNRFLVLINWAWDYLFYERALRFIFPSGKCSEKKAKKTG